MKIGILTYHKAENFGAIMQAYALVHFLNDSGYEAEIIDYRCINIEVRYDIYNPRVLLSRKNVLASLAEYTDRFHNLKDREIRKNKFRKFRKRIPMGKSVKKADDISDYDVVITGSDQVWNFHLNKGDENVFLLNFAKGKQFRRIAYAASSEKNGLSRISETNLRNSLIRFEKISVREPFLRDQLRNLIKKDITICLDPVFLLPPQEYDRIAIKPTKERYILIFHMTYSHEIVEFASKLAAEKGIELIECFGGFSSQRNSNSISDWGPEELLGWIANAEIVFTSSFHGLALSIILRRNVWLVDKGNNYRQLNLLRSAGLDERKLVTFDEYDDSCIDYDKVNDRLSPLIQNSKDFLNL